MKNIYFVRHGESDANAGGVFMANTNGLSEKGKEQAKIVAERFLKIKIDGVLTSTSPRAMDTGKANFGVKKLFRCF